MKLKLLQQFCTLDIAKHMCLSFEFNLILNTLYTVHFFSGGGMSDGRDSFFMGAITVQADIGDAGNIHVQVLRPITIYFKTFISIPKENQNNNNKEHVLTFLLPSGQLSTFRPSSS